MTRVVPKLLLLVALAALALPAIAAASPRQVVLDCSQDGTLDRTYSNKELKGALDQLQTDQLEYGDCAQIISSAIGAGAGKHGGGSGSDPSGGAGSTGGLNGAADPSALQSDQQALAALTHTPGDGSIKVGGKQVKPGENGVFDLASAENGVPTPLLLVLIALGVVALGGALLLLRRHMPAFSHASLPLKRIALPRGLARPRFRR